MFSRSAEYYDEIYASLGKNYEAEARRLRLLITRHKRSDGRALLDVACGTGKHAAVLSRWYQVEGVDLDAAMLRVARKKHPGIRFHQGDMVDFDLGKQYDVVTCLFSSIGYVRTPARLRAALRTMARHLRPGGVLLLEPWFSTRQWHPGSVRMSVNARSVRTIVRMSHTARRGRESILTFEYLIGTGKGINRASEIHRMGLFSSSEYKLALQRAGLEVLHDARGLAGRGLYIAKKPLT